MATKYGSSIFQILPAVLESDPLGAGAVSTAVIHRRVIGLFAANILSLVVVGASFVVYSRLLSPPEFGLYAVALSTATLLALILDAGLKTTIIKSEMEIPRDEESSIAVLMVVVSAGLILALVLFGKWFLVQHSAISHDARFVVMFVGIALLFYPFVTLPTAKLERQLSYGHIAWIESLGTLVERGGPALFLLFANCGIYSFVWALLLSRILRAAVLARFYRINLFASSWSGFLSSLRHLREGAWIQIGTITSVVRDNLHTLLIGPFFGKEWIGYYAWALQVCLVSSQVFAQISARVSLPLLAQAANFEERWRFCLYQIRMLTMLTVPMLFGVWLVLPILNEHFFQGKWQSALPLIPLLFARMIPGMATTPLGPLVMVQKGGAAFATINLRWTLVEVTAAVAFVWTLGPTGLALSYALAVWVGLWLLIDALSRNAGVLATDLLRQIVLRPSVICAALTTLIVGSLARVFHFPAVGSSLIYVLAAFVIVSSYLLEPELRGFLAHGET